MRRLIRYHGGPVTVQYNGRANTRLYIPDFSVYLLIYLPARFISPDTTDYLRSPIYSRSVFCSWQLLVRLKYHCPAGIVCDESSNSFTRTVCPVFLRPPHVALPRLRSSTLRTLAYFRAVEMRRFLKRMHLHPRLPTSFPPKDFPRFSQPSHGFAQQSFSIDFHMTKVSTWQSRRRIFTSFQSFRLCLSRC